MTNQKESWAPVPIRLVFGLNYLLSGFLKLATAAGQASTVRVLEGLGIPLPETLAWVLPTMELVAGLGLLVGAYLSVAAALAAISTGGLALLALIGGRLPTPFPGETLFPDYGISLILVTGLLALLISGAGPLSIDHARAARQRRKQTTLTLLAKIKPGQVDALRQLLTEINANIFQNNYIRFYEDRLTHFARWIILEDPDNGPRLLFTSAYNGALEPYIAELVRVSPGLDAIWSHCEGYTGHADFFQFVYRHQQACPYRFTAFPDESVESIRAKIALRQFIEGSPSALSVLAQLSSAAPETSGWSRLWNDLATLGPRTWRSIQDNIFTPLASLAADILAGVSMPRRYPLVGGTCDPHLNRPASAHVQALDENASNFVQNQFTVYAEVDSRYLWRLQFVFFLSRLITRIAYPPGDLSGVHTIHSLYWAVLDGGKRTVLMTNYDGTWDSYLGDFFNNLGRGLDIYFMNCKRYPPGGIRQVITWEAWVRERQQLCPLFYAAYPNENVLNILRDRAISRGLTQRVNREALEGWLALF